MKNTMIKFKEINPPAGLENKIYSRIEARAKSYNLKTKLLGFGYLFASFMIFAKFSVYLFDEFRKSGIFEYMSLLFTDYKLVMGNFGEFILSIVDSTPYFAISLYVLAILILMLGVRYLAVRGQKFVFDKIN